MGAMGGYNMKFGKGYLGGKKAEPDATGKEAGEAHQPGENEEDIVKGHLEQMHASTGNAHTHVHHHGDGNHTMHHISAEGQHSTEESGDCPGGMCGGM
jgi:hypothetical protein